MSFKEISNDYEKLLENENEYDVVIYAGENENLKEIHAHSLILSIRSQYFYAAFYNDWVEKKNGKFIFRKPNISPQLFEIILRFIYCGKIDLTNLQGSESLKLLMAVDELNIQTLISCVQKHLINDKEFLEENIIEILQIVYQNELFADLLDYCLDETKVIFNSDKFIDLEAPLLEFLLKRNDLNLDEIEIWNGLIKWGLAQERAMTLNQDISKWDQNDINNFKMILYKFIPLIRFYEISTDDYSNKVEPYGKILSKELQDEMYKFHLFPEYKPKLELLPRCPIDSTLVNRRHITLFANWIDKIDRDTKYISVPYKFNLLYRASRDGNTPKAFHTKCDNKGATIVVAKITNSEQIVGGYNPLFWDSNNVDKSTKDSFIFSITDKNNLQNVDVVYSKGDQYSVQCYSHCGPIFGHSDLYLNFCDHPKVWNHTNARSYPTLNLPYRMEVDDYEVFQVIKK